MNEVAVKARRLIDGRQITLPHLLRLEIGASLESPAVGMTAAFAADYSTGELGEIQVECGHRTLFAGAIDQQNRIFDAKGALLELEARSKGALLLDNEAVPCSLANVRLSTVFGLFAAPYGFTCLNPNTHGMLAHYTVRKGQSEWEALCGYTRRVFGLTPYVVGEQVMVDRPRSQTELEIGAGGIPFVRLEHRRIPYQVISKVVMRDEAGRYGSAVSNSQAAYYGVERKRYVIPTNEFVDNLALDANQRIQRSMLEMEEVLVRLPGLVETRIGQAAAVQDTQVRLRNLLVRSTGYKLDEKGFFTELSLVSSVYYI